MKSLTGSSITRTRAPRPVNDSRELIANNWPRSVVSHPETAPASGAILTRGPSLPDSAQRRICRPHEVASVPSWEVSAIDQSGWRARIHAGV